MSTPGTLVWPPNYVGEIARRMELEKAIASDPVMLAGARALYAASPATFIADCCWVYEPRNAAAGLPTRLPVVPFPRQREFIEWMHERFRTKTSAPVEKSRDSGATWMASAFAVWVWLFHEGSSVGFGSRKEDLVDRAGDMQSIFEKIRSTIRHLPPYLKPPGLKEKVHFNHMRIVHPTNDSSIIGEAGDNIGRGGRTSAYFIDESAFLERPALVEASLSATTDVRIDISTPAAGSVFDAWTSSSQLKFIFDVSDAPWHTPEWLAAKEADMASKGLGHLYRREFLRDASAGLAGQLIPSPWVEAAVGAAEKLGIRPSGKKIGALDVADGGNDRNALAMRHGICLNYCTSRADTLAGDAGLWAFDEATRAGMQELRYDSIGVGAGAATSLRGKKGITIVGWSASDGVVDPLAIYEGNRTNEDMFSNAKAQAWWLLRDRFLRTYQAVVMGKKGLDLDTLISLDGDLEEIREIKSELSQVTYKHNPSGKVQINKAPDGHASPNRADSIVIAFAPVSAGISVIGIF